MAIRHIKNLTNKTNTQGGKNCFKIFGWNQPFVFYKLKLIYREVSFNITSKVN